MTQIYIEIPNMDNLTCGMCPCRDAESDFCNLEYAINGNYKNVDTVYNSRPQNCPIKHISNEDMLKEQKGRIIELPCDVGDKAFWVSKDGIKEVIVDSFVVNINIFANVSYYIGCERFGKTLTPYKTLFFTKEEAEKILKQLKGGAEE